MIVNMLMASLLMYRLAVLPLLTTEIVNKFTEIVRNFIWGGGRCTIKMETLMLNKQEWGLGLIDIRKKVLALKVQWVLKVFHNQKIRNLVGYFLRNPLGNTLWKCQLIEPDIKELFKPGFWRDVLVAWNKLQFKMPENITQIKHEIIWYNSNIRIGGTPCLHNEMFKKGILQIKDLIDGNRFFSWEELKEKYRLSNCYLHYYAIMEAIPKFWKNLLIEGGNEGNNKTQTQNLFE